MDDRTTLASFEQLMLPHMGAAHNLARWLLHSDHDAQDAVQEAYLRAWRFFGSFRGGDSRSWLLAIVRNACLNRLHDQRVHRPPEPLQADVPAGPSLNPGAALMNRDEARIVRQAIEELPPEQREVIILRELQDLSYKEIAAVTGTPLGTVMSRLARARVNLQDRLTGRVYKET